MRKVALWSLGVMLLLALLAGALVFAQRDIPAPTGTYPVGRMNYLWTDTVRPEEVTPNPDDQRMVAVHIFYPAVPGTGRPDVYFPNLEVLQAALSESGQVDAIELMGLPLVRTTRIQDALVASDGGPWPVVLLSPGYGTNVEFYACLAEELASHGYTVVGMAHPYDVAAVDLGDGHFATLTNVGWADIAKHQAWIQRRAPVRVADALFVLRQLEQLANDADGPFSGRLDFARLAILGHSLGGITAAEAAAAEPRFKAAINLDGVQLGGVLAVGKDYKVPACPFLLVTKETELSPGIAAQFQELTQGGWRMVIPEAEHEDFSDGPVLLPSLIPGYSRADRVLALTRQGVREFLDQSLRGKPSPMLAETAQTAGYRVEAYPAGAVALGSI